MKGRTVPVCSPWGPLCEAMEVKPGSCWKTHAIREPGRPWRQEPGRERELNLAISKAGEQSNLCPFTPETELGKLVFSCFGSVISSLCPIPPFGNSHVYSALIYVEALGLQWLMGSGDWNSGPSTARQVLTPWAISPALTSEPVTSSAFSSNTLLLHHFPREQL